jgi:hypothetical protein
MRGGYDLQKRRYEGAGCCVRAADVQVHAIVSATVLEAPSASRPKWRLGLTATAAALVLAGGIIFVQQMPGAERLHAGDDALNATSPQTIALYDLRPAPIVQYDGARGAGLKVSVSTGRISKVTRNALSGLGVQVPNVRGAQLEWQARPPAMGQISVKVGNQRQSPDAGVMFQATGGGEVTQLTIRAVQTVVTAQIDIATNGADLASAPELKFGGASFRNPALAFSPIQIEIPPGETMSLTFDSEQALAASTFRLGNWLDGERSTNTLPVGRAEVGQLSGSHSYPTLRPVTQGVCGSRPGALLFTHRYPQPGECHLAAEPKGDRLMATAMTVGAGKIGLALKGSGFVLKDDHARSAASWSTLVANPVLAALFAALVYAIGRPLWRLWTGRDM